MSGKEQYDPEFVADILRIDELPPEHAFRNIKELLSWLGDEKPRRYNYNARNYPL